MGRVTLLGGSRRGEEAHTSGFAVLMHPDTRLGCARPTQPDTLSVLLSTCLSCTPPMFAVPQRPKKRKKRRRRRAHTPPDTTDEDNDDCESDPDDDGQPRRCRLRIPPLGTRLRRWWRRNWYHFHRTYLMALRRKDLPPWRAL